MVAKKKTTKFVPHKNAKNKSKISTNARLKELVQIDLAGKMTDTQLKEFHMLMLKKHGHGYNIGNV